MYAIGCQPRFATLLVKDGKRHGTVRPEWFFVRSFAQTGIQ